MRKILQCVNYLDDVLRRLDQIKHTFDPCLNSVPIQELYSEQKENAGTI